MYDLLAIKHDYLLYTKRSGPVGYENDTLCFSSFKTDAPLFSGRRFYGHYRVDIRWLCG
jgi:hypothetical protein